MKDSTCLGVSGHILKGPGHEKTDGCYFVKTTIVIKGRIFGFLLYAKQYKTTEKVVI